MSLHFYFIIIITVSLCMICMSQEHVVYMLHMYHSTHHMSKDNFQRPFFPSSLGSRDQTQTTGSVPLSTFTSWGILLAIHSCFWQHKWTVLWSGSNYWILGQSLEALAQMLPSTMEPSGGCVGDPESTQRHNESEPLDFTLILCCFLSTLSQFSPSLCPWKQSSARLDIT